MNDGYQRIIIDLHLPLVLLLNEKMEDNTVVLRSATGLVPVLGTTQMWPKSKPVSLCPFVTV